MVISSLGNSVCNGLERSGGGHLDCPRPIPPECYLHVDIDACFTHCCILDVLANAWYMAGIPLILDFERELGENFPMWPGSYENVSPYSLILLAPTSWQSWWANREHWRILKLCPISALLALDCENQLLPKLAWVRFWSLSPKSTTITLHSPASA